VQYSTVHNIAVLSIVGNREEEEKVLSYERKCANIRVADLGSPSERNLEFGFYDLADTVGSYLLQEV
jgi:hypothetical protein